MEYVNSTDPGDINRLRQAVLERQTRNETGIETDAHHVNEFIASGMPKAGLQDLRRKVLGKHAPGPQTHVPPAVIRALVLDAKPWLSALREYGRRHPESVTSDQSVAGWHEALPFLDSVEVSYVVSKEGRGSWRRTATYLLQRRLAAERNLQPSTIYEYAFGPSEASKFRNRISANRNPITPPVPP